MTTNLNIAIRGHNGRGNEVIEILEMLGGQISQECGYEDGFDHHYAYFIDTKENFFIDGFLLGDKIPTEFSIFTLEEFLEKYPYKIGDKVTLEGWPCTIIKAYWNYEDNNVVYLVKGVDFSKQAYSEDLQPYSELEIINRSDQISNKELQDILKQFPDDAIVAVEYCNIRELRYIKDRNLIVID